MVGHRPDHESSGENARPSLSSALSQRVVMAQLAIAMTLAMTTWFSATAVLPQLRFLWAVPSSEIAWLTAAVQVGFIVGAIVAALTNLSDLGRPQVVVFVSAIGAATANALLVVAPSFEVGVLLRFVSGMFAAGIYPPLLKLMSTHFQHNRGLALGILVGALTLGSAAPHFVNGAVPVSWQRVIIAASTLTLLGAFVALFTPTGPFPFPRPRFDPRHIADSFTRPGLVLANLGYFGHMWELYAMWSWFAVFFADALSSTGYDPRYASLGTFAVIGVGAVGCVGGGILGDRWGRTLTTSLSMAISGVCAALIGFSYGSSPWLVLTIGLLWGVAIVADSAQFSTMTTELADAAFVGTSLTVQMAVGFSLTVATIWLIPMVHESVGWRWTFAVLAPGPALGILAMLALRRRPEATQLASGRR
jgi:MFS family permease